MPKKNKVRIAKLEKNSAPNPNVAMLAHDDSAGLKCNVCGRVLAKKKSAYSSFYTSSSIFHKGTGGYIPVCKDCINNIYQEYRFVLGSEKEAMRRMCMKLDVYWSEHMFSVADSESKNGLKFSDYLKKINTHSYRSKTYDTTIDEEAVMVHQQIQLEKSKSSMLDNEYEVTPEQVVVWGAGLDSMFYAELDAKYDYWTKDLDMDKVDKAMETLIRQICIQQVTLSRDAAAGRPIDKTTKVIDSLIGSLNLKPVQKDKSNKNVIDEATEKTPFGVWIRRIEDDRPIPEPDDELRDVDSLREYLQTWFLGGLCNMMRIPNEWSDMFDAAMEQYTVEKPEYESDEEDVSLEDILDKAEEEGRKQRSESGEQ